jgi:hypothetical protein
MWKIFRSTWSGRYQWDATCGWKKKEKKEENKKMGGMVSNALIDNIGHGGEVVHGVVLAGDDDGEVSEVTTERVGLPAEDMFDLCIGETGSVEDNAGTDSKGVGWPSGKSGLSIECVGVYVVDNCSSFAEEGADDVAVKVLDGAGSGISVYGEWEINTFSYQRDEATDDTEHGADLTADWVAGIADPDPGFVVLAVLLPPEGYLGACNKDVLVRLSEEGVEGDFAFVVAETRSPYTQNTIRLL